MPNHDENENDHSTEGLKGTMKFKLIKSFSCYSRLVQFAETQNGTQ